MLPIYQIETFLHQRPLSKCTIMDRIDMVSNPVRVTEIQTPKGWPLVPLRAAYARGAAAHLYAEIGRVIDYSFSYFLPGYFHFHVVRRVG